MLSSSQATIKNGNNNMPKRDKIFGSRPDTGRDFRTKYVCTKCRKVRRVLRGDRLSPMACGHCGGHLNPTGPMLKVPKANTRRGKRAWKYIEKKVSKHNAYHKEVWARWKKTQ